MHPGPMRPLERAQRLSCRPPTCNTQRPASGYVRPKPTTWRNQTAISAAMSGRLFRSNNRVEAALPDGRRGIGRHQKIHKGFCRIALLGVSRDRSRDWAYELHLVRQRTSEIDSRHCDEFADLLQAEIDLATCDRHADQLTRDLPGLGRHLAFYSQRLE